VFLTRDDLNAAVAAGRAELLRDVSLVYGVSLEGLAQQVQERRDASKAAVDAALEAIDEGELAAHDAYVEAVLKAEEAHNNALNALAPQKAALVQGEAVVSSALSVLDVLEDQD